MQISPDNPTLFSRGGRVYRCVGVENSRALLLVGGAPKSYALANVKPLPVVKHYWQSFDEWGGRPDDTKAMFIRAAVFDNPQILWSQAAVNKIIDNLPIFNYAVWETAAVVRAGHTRYGMRTILEVARHNTSLNMLDRDFKINNNAAPDMARVIMCLFPEVPAGFFETRRSVCREGVSGKAQGASDKGVSGGRG